MQVETKAEATHKQIKAKVKVRRSCEQWRSYCEALKIVASLSHRLPVYKKNSNRLGVKALCLGLENSGVAATPFASLEKKSETVRE